MEETKATAPEQAGPTEEMSAMEALAVLRLQNASLKEALRLTLELLEDVLKALQPQSKTAVQVKRTVKKLIKILAPPEKPDEEAPNG
jgi:hypothetical protein